MFKLFSRSKKAEAGNIYSQLRTDMHSHLLPGIDDGAPDMATSLKLIKGMTELGYTRLITTPHVMGDMYPNSRDTILRKLGQVREAVSAEGISAEINAAAEYFLDEYLARLLKKNEPLLTISGNMVLTEFSLAWKPHGIKDILFEMQMQGYQPVIAHPERYIYLQHNKEFYGELKDIGCFFQLNILAIGGYYGKSVQDLAQYLVKKNYYELIGTDLHNIHHLEKLQQLSSPLLSELLSSGSLQNTSL